MCRIPTPTSSLRIRVEIEADRTARLDEDGPAEAAPVAFLYDTILDLNRPDVHKLVHPHARKILVQRVRAAAARRLAADLRGVRVLDIGTSDGFFALQLARGAAEVVAIDYRGKQNHVYYVKELLNPIQIEYHKMNVYELADKHLQFDVVLFMGVLYHLPDMLRALHLIRQCYRDMLFIETHSENDFCRDSSAARYYRGSTLANDHTNFCAPNRLCVLDMLHDTGFDVERDEAWGQRLFVAAKAVEI